MGSTASPELISKTIAWIMLITITAIVFITAITIFNNKYKESMYNIRLGNIYIFDAFTKYKQTIMASLILLFIVLFTFRFKQLYN